MKYSKYTVLKHGTVWKQGWYFSSNPTFWHNLLKETVPIFVIEKMHFVLNCFGFNGVSCKCHCWWHRIIDRKEKKKFPNKNNLISTFFFTSLLIQLSYWQWPLNVFHCSTICREQWWCTMHGESTGLPPSDTYMYLGWLCYWFSQLLWEVFLPALQLSPQLKSHHFNLECTFTRVLEKA